MTKISNYMIVVFLAVTFLLPRVCMPVSAFAEDKISHIEPHFLSTPQKAVTMKETTVRKSTSNSKSWVLGLVGLVVLAAVAGGAGGGSSSGGSSSSGSSGGGQSGGVEFGW